MPNVSSSKGNYFRRRRFSSEEIDAAFHHALQRKGFLVGLSPYIAFTQGITLNNGDLGSSDVRVNTDGEGLPYQLVSGIQPLGPIEEKYLRRLFVYSRT